MGSHAVEAAYSGDAVVAASTGKLTQAVGPDATATEVSSAPNPSVYGEPVTLTAAVRAAGVDTPTGAVTFLVDGNEVCTATLVSGAATCDPGIILDAGSHDVVATYPGDADFAPSSGTATHQVAPAATGVDVTSGANPSVVGQPVTFTAQVTVPPPGGGEPTGTVRFLVGSEPFGDPVPVTGGIATSPAITFLPAGIAAVTAEYSGDANHAGNTQTLFQDVVKATTTTTLTTSANPATDGTRLTLTARVAADAGGQPTGAVRFSIGGKPVCVAPIDTGTATCRAPHLRPGDHAIEADYMGDLHHLPSRAVLTQRITRLATLTILTSTAEPTRVGEPVTIRAHVADGLPGRSTTGVVTFTEGSTVLATVAVQLTPDGRGLASFETDQLPPGAHLIVGTYGGNEFYAPSTSRPLVQRVRAGRGGPPGRIEPTFTG